MKIPSSSSILLAGLAISSSSSCLAAPTGDGTQDGDTISSSSTDCASSSVPPTAYPTPINAQERSNSVEPRDTSPSTDGGSTNPICAIVTPIPVIGGLLGPVVCNSVPNSLNTHDLAALQNAADEISRAVKAGGNSGLPVSSTVGGGAGAAPVSPPVGGDAGAASHPGASGTGAPPGPTDVAAANSTPNPNDGSGSPSYTSASATPSSPATPNNPPNTPS